MTSIFSDITLDNALDLLAEEVGICPSYWDIEGISHTTTQDTKREILRALGIAAETDEDAVASLKDWREKPWQRLAPPVMVLRRHEEKVQLEVEVSIQDNLQFTPLHWILSEENGTIHNGECHISELQTIDVADVRGETISKRRLTLPNILPDGYHTLTLNFAGKQGVTTIIIAPSQSYIPEWMAAGERRWGISCQTYGLRTDPKQKKDWGIGDFADLSDFMESASALGAAMVGINPIHALFPTWPDACSPYSPSSRSFLNPLMIAIERIPFADKSEGLAKFTRKTAIRSALKDLRGSKFVNYPKVTDLKYKALQALYHDFLIFGPEDTPEAYADFEDYCEIRGEPLQKFAQFCAIHEAMGGLPWHAWPPQFRNPHSPAVIGFTAANAEQVTFHAFLQWLCDMQMDELVQNKPDIGLYRDLAIGCNYDGADSWANQDGLADGISFGAPPDAFSAVGQDWGLPPPHPITMRETAYADFIRMVQSNMNNADALRIDHVMGLLRLFWIPHGKCALEGAYVSYPLDDLLGILALESHRNACLVIGEDLGTVPEDFRDKMAKERLLSYRVLYFERWESGLFRRPEVYPELALATPTTHDMPTIAGHWCGTDITLREDVSREDATIFGTEDDISEEREERDQSRDDLMGALEDQWLVPDPMPAKDHCSSLEGLTHSVLRYTARTPCRLMMVNIGDLLQEMTQINLPGTVDQHPNWRRRLDMSCRPLANDPKVKANVAAIKMERSS